MFTSSCMMLDGNPTKGISTVAICADTSIHKIDMSIRDKNTEFVTKYFNKMTSDVQLPKDCDKEYSGKIPPKNKFTPEEDEKLLSLVQSLGSKNWITIAHRMETRNPRQCRERWNNYVNPDLRKDTWTKEEDYLLDEKYLEYGPKWNKISRFFVNRSDNNIRNRWMMLMRHRNKAKHQQKASPNNNKQQISKYYIQHQDSPQPLLPVPVFNSSSSNNSNTSINNNSLNTKNIEVKKIKSLVMPVVVKKDLRSAEKRLTQENSSPSMSLALASASASASFDLALSAAGLDLFSSFDEINMNMEVWEDNSFF